MTPLGNTIRTRRERFRRSSLGDGLCRSTLSRPRSWRLIEKLVRPQSRRWVPGIKSRLRRGWMHGGVGFCAFAPTREKERAVWRSSWRLSPRPLSGIGARFRQEDQISSDSLEMRTTSFLDSCIQRSSFRLHVRETSSLRESVAIDFMESANENAIGVAKYRKWGAHNLRIFFFLDTVKIITFHTMQWEPIYFESSFVIT